MTRSFIERFGGSNGMVGQASLERARRAGLSINQIRNALSAQGIGTGPKAREYLAGGGRNFVPSGQGPTDFTKSLDQTQLASNLRVLGTQGGGIGIQGYKDLVSLGHSPMELEEAVENAAKYGLKIGTDLESYLRSGIDPRETREQAAANTQAINDQTASIEAQTKSALESADALRAQMEDQFKIQQQAAAERAKAAKEAQRMQMIRERGAGRASDLQIQGAARGPRRRGGSTGFRRRQDQFRISPYKGVGIGAGAIGAIAKGAANRMVNI
jgi:DNA-binding transcriptional MerR regulator|tara:strand:+ start:45 stop:857 length:813 start_codon:yes stop_codon:yes gene_type:complete